MRNLPLPALAFISIFAALSLPHVIGAAENTFQLKVSAGDIDRQESVVSFALPPAAGGAYRLQDADGHSIPVQVDSEKHAAFILKQLAKGSTRSYRLIPAQARATSPQGVQVSRAGSKLKITQAGQPVLEYQAEPGEFPRPDIKTAYRRGGYLHPVFSPSGKLLTDDFPRNHIHHHGIWFPWTKTEFEGRRVDFWNMGEGTGRVEFASLDETWSGPVHGGFRARHRFVDLTNAEPKVALNESWDVRVYRTGTGEKPRWTFDLISTQTCATASPLILPQYYYGGLGFRGNWEWNGKDKTSFLTSEGETDRVKGNEKRARWCYLGGTVEGQLTGLAILGHPDNFRAPQPMRLHPSEPFFCYAPSQLGPWEIKPGKPYVSRYRFIVFDGPADKAELDRLWVDYAQPAAVRVE